MVNEVHDPSSQAAGRSPWWVRCCQRLWKIIAFLGSVVILGLCVNTLSTWFTNSKGWIPSDSPFGWLVTRWPDTLLTGSCLLLVAAFIWVLSRWPIQAATHSPSAQQNRKRMLRRLRHDYDEILSESLQGSTPLEVRLTHQPGAVENATGRLWHLPHRIGRALAAAMSMLQAYEKAAQELLVLGEAGAGKSTLLIQLAQHLVTEAEKDDTQPLPLLLPLSSWSGTRPRLEDWLREQVNLLYGIPEQLAFLWIQEERFLLLLDGLDEVEE